MIIVSNTSPINYLILIGQIDLLPELFGQIIIPQVEYYTYYTLIYGNCLY